MKSCFKLALERPLSSACIALSAQGAVQCLSACLGSRVQEELQAQLGAMQAELGALERDLASRDGEAADLSRCLADLRAKLGNPAAPPHANGAARAALPPGALLAKIGASKGGVVAAAPDNLGRH